MSRTNKSQRIRLWLDRLNRFAESGLKVAEFCQREQVSVPSFYQWKRRLAPQIQTPKKTRRSRQVAQSGSADSSGANCQPAGFTELVVKRQSHSAQALLPNGITITFGDQPETVGLIVDRLLKYAGTSASSAAC